MVCVAPRIRLESRGELVTLHSQAHSMSASIQHTLPKPALWGCAAEGTVPSDGFAPRGSGRASLPCDPIPRRSTTVMPASSGLCGRWQVLPGVTGSLCPGTHHIPAPSLCWDFSDVKVRATVPPASHGQVHLEAQASQ